MTPLQAAVFCKHVYANKTGEVDDLEFVVRRHRHAVWVGIRGSEPLIHRDGSVECDWLRNLHAMPWYSPEFGGLVHAGFLDGARAIYPEIEAQVIFAREGEHTPVYVAGHSLGGALALLIGAMLEREGFNVYGVYTFGAPKVSTDCVGHALQAVPEVHQYQNLGDPVPYALNWFGLAKRVGTVVDTRLDVFDGPLFAHDIDTYIEAVAALDE